MGPELNLKAPSSLSSVFSTQVGLLEGVKVRGGGRELWGEVGRAAKQQLIRIKCFNIYKALPYIILFKASTICILQVGRLQLREVQWLVQDHTAVK